MKSSGNDDEMITDINVTPFVDVVLVLLILFMIAAPAVYQTGIKINLPKVASGEKSKHITMSIMISSAGILYVEQEKVTTDILQSIIKKALKLDPTSDVVLKADKTLTYDKVISIIDLLKTSGIKNIALATESK